MVSKPKKKILAAGPSITQKEIDYVAKAAKDGWDENFHKYTSEFERKFAKYIGVKYAIATSSCTGALHLAFLSLGIKKGDEVITPDATWIATIAPACYLGAKPVFVDIDHDSWCIDPDKIEKKITKNTKVIIPVHLYGHPAEMEKILNIAKKHKLYVIEDAGESIGATYRGKMTGSFGDFSCFSFHGSKTMVTGEGGMLLTNNHNLYKRANFLNNHGKDPKKTLWNLDVGYKYKMSDLQAALGIVQLSRIKEFILKKKKIFNWYKKRLGKIPGIKLNSEKPGCKNTYWLVTVILDKKFGIKKERLIKEFLKYNIEARPFFYPLSSLPPFKVRVNNPVSYGLSLYGINLPSGLNLTEKEVDFICQSLIKILKT